MRSVFAISELSVSSSSSSSAGIRVRFERPDDVRLEVAFDELAAGDVHRDLHRARPRRASTRRSARRRCAMTQRPTRTMRPVSSSTGMKSAGETRPWPGRSQRSSASTPMMRPLSEVDLRLVVQHELVVASTRSRSAVSSVEPGQHLGVHLRR